MLIWDTSGQESTRVLRRQAQAWADAYILVFDVSSRRSFLKLLDMIEEVRRCKKIEPARLRLTLVGTERKLDVKRQVFLAEAQELAAVLCCTYLETSLSNGNNNFAIFRNTICQLVRAEHTMPTGAGLDLSRFCLVKSTTRATKNVKSWFLSLRSWMRIVREISQHEIWLKICRPVFRYRLHSRYDS